METKLKNSTFQEISGIFPDLLTLNDNIKQSKAVKVNLVLFTNTK